MTVTVPPSPPAAPSPEEPPGRARRFGRAGRAGEGVGIGEAVGLAGALAVAFATGLVLRLQVVHGPLGYIDLDEATVGLQAQHFASHPQVFFAGQPYGGTLEIAVVALVQHLAGTGPWPLKATAVAFHLLACVVVWRVAARMLRGRLAQLAAPVFMWCGPAAGIWESTKERGFYGAAVLLAALVILFVVRLDERPSAADALGLGLALGVGWWTTPLIALVGVPAVAWYVARRPSRWQAASIVVPAAILGALPWFAWNLRNGWGSLRQPADFGTDVGHRFGSGIVKIAVLLGVETPWNAGRTFVPAARLVAVLLLVVALGIATWRTWSTARGLLAACVGGYLVLYPLANATGTVGSDPRYLYLLLPTLALVLAGVLPDLDGVAHRRVLVPIVLVALTVASAGLSVWGLHGLTAASDTDPRFLGAAGLTEVIHHLEQQHVRRVTTDVAGTQITYDTEGRIQASSFAAPRFADLERVTLVRRPSVYVLQAGLFHNDRRLVRWLRAHHIGYLSRRYGAWSVYYLDRWVPPWDPALGALGQLVTPPS